MASKPTQQEEEEEEPIVLQSVAAVADEAKKSRTFRKFSYRGIDLEALLDVTPQQVGKYACGGRRRTEAMRYG